ncbi:hemolysin family protein [Kaistia dalseonensis]|uniref:CBS domain containing-hemolysin-like protein n=1 Tax=Kaistia dalseonensis TaxID=410840 RepID=A0ABU0H634_9HYPH|nr:hemolysin family protein [Kaistia dalseonensis]MCX5494906.1 hemolysin family protein [Kaistia dalseonensis]MDQ0437487.1 CBS domain containing-hemolysin-like protein [Kaistia dalseonensis]
MTDTDTPGSGAETNPDPQSIQPPAAELREVERAPESWFDRLRQAVGLKPSNSLREEIEDALEANEAEDDFTAEERGMLRNILKLREVRVDDVMVPRADILALDEAMTVGEALAGFRDSGHSRMPVYRESLDDPIGMIHIKDLMDYITTAATAPSGLDFGRVDLAVKVTATELVREVLFVPPSMPAATLLSTMQASHVQMAVVIDEYGGTDGLVSLEDVVEIVFGDIEDEHDDEEAPLISREPDGAYLADARADLEDLEAILGTRLDLGSEHDDVDTLGGLVFTLLGRIPVAGERIDLPGGLEFEILDSDTRRVKRLRVRRSDAAAA